MAEYIGITLGPIGETMNLTSTPAGLWAASYLFSYLAHGIREKIGKDGLLQDDLKYDGEKTVGSLFSKGVGLYHDRIIYEADAEHTLENAVEAVKDSVAEIVKGFVDVVEFREEKPYIEQFFNDYFNIHIVSIETKPGESFLIKVNDALDAAELEKNFPTKIKYNPILKLFDGDNGGGEDNEETKKEKNENIKSSFLVSGNDDKRKQNWVLTGKTGYGIKDLPTIAASNERTYIEENGKKEKASKYYAVIRADGDNMGSTVKKILDEKSYIEFSDKCFRYGCKTAEIVLKYGGIPIYVGGDDLLCIAPLMCFEGKKTFLDMISEIRKAFKEEFEGEPDLSFGVQIQYHKAPLYEALDRSAGLLFGTAKANKPGALAINLQKHSGQSADVLIKGIGQEAGGKMILNKLDELIIKHASEKTLKSVGKHVSDFAVLLDNARKDDTSIDHFFDNVFDNGVSDKDREYIDEVKELAKLINKHAGDADKDNKDDKKDKKLSDKLGSAIRLIKFFSEKLDKEEKKQ